MSLSSLIVQREVATIRQVEEALARQVLYGGDLVTNVLEVAQVPEHILVPLLAETVHMPHAPLGPLPAPSPDARALVPQELAIRRSILPLELTAGRLVVAVAEALGADVLEEFSFALGVQVEQRVAPLVRIREALATHYGAPLDRRMTRLIGRLAGNEAPGSGSLPPLLQTIPHTTLRTPTQQPPRLRRETPRIGSLEVGQAETHRTNTRFPETHQTNTAFPAQPIESQADAPPLFEGPPPADGPEADGPPSVVIRASVMVGPEPVQKEEVVAISNPTSTPTSISNPSPTATPTPTSTPTATPTSTEAPRRPSSEPPASHPSSLVRGMRLASMPPRSGRRRRGPITLERAKLELEQANERDTLLDLLFDFSLQFFEYTALFIAHGDLAEGRDAYGPGASRDKVLGVGVPLDLPSALSAARDRSAPIIAKPAKEGLDAVLVEDLERNPEWPILVVPLVVRGRTVALLYGDNGEMGVDGAGSGEVTGFAARVGQAFERIIVRRKLGGFAADHRTTGPRVDPTRVAAKSPGVGDPETRAAALRKALVTEGFVPTPSRPPAATAGDVDPSLTSRTTVRDPTPPAATAWGESRSHMARDFNEMPPPPQVAVVRPLSGRPIPREDPPTLALDLTPARREVSGPPTIDVGHLEEADEEKLLRELDELSPDPRAPDLSEGDSGEEGAELPPVAASTIPKAPPSRSLAVAPHPPPPPRSRPDVLPSALPSVIVDVESEFLPLVDRLMTDPADEHAEAELLRRGHHAMPAIMARFPGPIALTPAEIQERKARVGECGPLLRLIAGQRRVALPFVLAEVNGAELERRFWATFLLTELAYPEAVPSIVARLFDEEERTRRVARWAARIVGQSSREALVEELDRIVRDPRAEAEKGVAIMETLGELRDSAVVPVLLGSLGSDSAPVAQAARRALSLVSRQDFGGDMRRWLAWWSTNSSRHRVEWLIDALTHDQIGIRKAAAQELKTVTREYFGYYEDLPKRERERAQQRYRDWWRSEGHARFRWM
jgi:hypothetical protein